MISRLAARCDGADYGHTFEFAFSKDRLSYRPYQIQARINQNPDISRQFSLWNRMGSRVILGNQLIILLEHFAALRRARVLRAKRRKVLLSGAARHANANSVYLASYSGRVVVVDENGEGLRVYDIGSVAPRIVDTGEYVYILTGTRLYVPRADSLHALIDTLDRGNLVIAKSGFGLLERSASAGSTRRVACLEASCPRDPIRRVYCYAEGMVVETRQRRAVVSGAPAWWE